MTEGAVRGMATGRAVGAREDGVHAKSAERVLTKARGTAFIGTLRERG